MMLELIQQCLAQESVSGGTVALVTAVASGVTAVSIGAFKLVGSVLSKKDGNSNGGASQRVAIADAIRDLPCMEHAERLAGIERETKIMSRSLEVIQSDVKSLLNRSMCKGGS